MVPCRLIDWSVVLLAQFIFNNVPDPPTIYNCLKKQKAVKKIWLISHMLTWNFL